jgi:hypothetical protein
MILTCSPFSNVGAGLDETDSDMRKATSSKVRSSKAVTARMQGEL